MSLEHRSAAHVYGWPIDALDSLTGGEAARGALCTLCHCSAVAKLFGFTVCGYHLARGEDDAPCPLCDRPLDD